MRNVDDPILPYTSEFSFRELAFDMFGTFNEPFYVEKQSTDCTASRKNRREYGSPTKERGQQKSSAKNAVKNTATLLV